MNKLLQISMTMLLVGSLAACGTNNNNNDDVADNNATTDNAADTNINTDTDTVETDTDDANGNEGRKVELADDIADKIKGMEEVENANVFVTDNNAYVAVELKEGVDASEELENKVADEARATNANYNNVYVTTNPDYAKQFNDYGEKIRANEPVQGFFEDFTDTVQRVFPDAH